MGDLVRAFPKTARPLCEYHDRLLRDRSPLTMAQRELIAAYVSGLNACGFCYGAHTLAAKAFGIDRQVIDALVDDVGGSAVEPEMKPILRYVKKLTERPAGVTAADARAVYDAGWSEAALFDAICVCALFNFMNRLVEGTGMRSNPLMAPPELQTELKQTLAGADTDRLAGAHEGPPQYTRLLDVWGIAPRGQT